MPAIPLGIRYSDGLNERRVDGSVPEISLVFGTPICTITWRRVTAEALETPQVQLWCQQLFSTHMGRVPFEAGPQSCPHP